MTQALGIAASSVNADMTAIDTLAQNIANAQTPGYIAETANLSSVPGGAGDRVGSGVQVLSITQATNALLSANNWQAQGALSNLSALQESLSAIENVFPLPTQAAGSTSATSGSGISGLLSSFWSAWDAIAQNPSSLAPRTEAVDGAQGLVTALHQAATQLTQITQHTVTQLTDQLTQVNSLLAQAARLNHSIVAQGSGAASASLSDQLRAVIDTLSKFAGADVQMQSDGTATISIGGMAVVQGSTAVTLTVVAQQSTATGSSGYGIELKSTSGTGVVVPVSSGSIAGLLSTVNTYLPAVRKELNGVAQALATKVNSTLKTAFLPTGAPAAGTVSTPTPQHWQMFTNGAGSTTGITAANITVNKTMEQTPSLIAVSRSSTPSAAKNTGAVAQKMAELGTTPKGPDATYQTLVENIGAATQSVNDQLQAQTAVATQATQALQAVSGVNVTEELTSLLTFQQNYEASAKVLTTVDATVQALLQAV
jgi:flagellar hook-associated protein 1 FlgK